MSASATVRDTVVFSLLGLAATVGAIALAPDNYVAPTVDLAPAERVLPLCDPGVVLTAWDAPVGCDLSRDAGGSLNWSDELSDVEGWLGDVDDAREFCQHWGGVFAVEPTDPMTVYCIGVDF